MAIPVGINSIIEVTVEGTMNEQQVMNVFHYYVSGSNIPDFEDFFINTFAPFLEGVGKLYDSLIQSMSAQVTDLAIYGQPIYPVRYRAFKYTPGVNAGVRAGNAMPPNVGAAITKQADKAGRRYVGTTHLYGLLQTDVTAGAINGAYRVLMFVICDAIKEVYIDAGTGAELAPVIFHRANPIQSETITQAYPQRTSRVERRRTVGLGS